MGKRRGMFLCLSQRAQSTHTHTLNTLFLFLGRWTNVTRSLFPLPPRVRRRRYYYVCAHWGENVRLLVINPDTKWTLFSCLVGIWKRRESAVLWAKRGEKKDNRSVCYCCTVCLKTLEKKKKRESILSPDATKKENKALLLTSLYFYPMRREIKILYKKKSIWPSSQYKMELRAQCTVQTVA